MKQKVFSLLLATVFLSTGLLAQGKFFTKTGKVYFNCTGGIEPIEGTNKSTTCVLDSKSGAIQFSMLMKGFEFEKQLMMEHFNENYVETEKFPKATFVGQIANNSEINYAKDGTYPAKVKGKLTIHGETRDVEAPGKITVKGGKIIATSDFKVQLSDYKVGIPSIVKDKISNDVKINVDLLLDPLKG
ncbi:MAG: YceI family protein [Chitinophagaceae bacterium]|nr:YceI family protein [Chitinophagaceae bacterium]